ncbi:uncharacterized protein FIESC28_00264 [Fusarium coffeatum]|uniref:Uncharacterized protein n=1 Tax=Fusarium coffeatum TaxID=231269 RepID=A0A366SEB0_9HYPO|nr:uncharacterized protein FIESC28_00264 [Fusarium coffeatum]RBR26996.1 hypothetical protein FIESC28_00264 [Fusarium coffeatum]
MDEYGVTGTEQVSGRGNAFERKPWTADPDCLDVDLDFDTDIEQALKLRANDEPWDKTELRRIKAVHRYSRTLDVDDVFLNDMEARKLQVTQNDRNTCFELFFIPRYNPPEQKSPTRQSIRLPISPPALRHLSSTYLIPSAFVEAALRRFKVKVCATVFRRRSRHAWEYWCLIPVRMNTHCPASASEHETPTAGSNQMNPSNHIHLDGGKQLQEEISKQTQGFIDTSKDLNVALHTMAAHLLRYKTELNRIGLILSDLRNHRRDMTYVPARNEDELACLESWPAVDHEAQRIERLASNLTATSNFCDELEKKVQNILALLFNQIQAVNDRTLQSILNASHQENRVTHELSIASHMLSQSMKRDSIAMKTVDCHNDIGILAGSNFCGKPM